MKKTRLKSVSEKLMENEFKELYDELYGHHVEIGYQRMSLVSCAKCGATGARESITRPI
jgi:hypothetical protein